MRPDTSSSLTFSGENEGADCPFCGLALEGSPNRCPRCGKIIGESAQDIKRVAEKRRRTEQRRKTFADLAFLVGLLSGGPQFTLGSHRLLGLFLVLAGALASTLHRYARTTLPGSLTIGASIAAVLAVLVIDLTKSDPTENQAVEGARGAFLTGLDRSLGPIGGSVEGRGPGTVVAWFYLPPEALGECGTYPAAEIRRHLSELGFVRVVIADDAAGPGLCAFKP